MSKETFVSSSLLRTFLVSASLAAVVLAANVVTALAGGFQLSIETPSASGDSQMKNAVLVVRTYGCHQPANARLAATAEGLLNGERKSLPLTLKAIGEGVYAITQQWPEEGNWVLAFTGAYNGMTSSVLVQLGPNGRVLPGTRLNEGSLKGVHATGARRKWVAQEIDAALQTTPGITGSTSTEPEALTFSPFGPITWLVAGMGASVFAIGFLGRGRRGRVSN